MCHTGRMEQLISQDEDISSDFVFKRMGFVCLFWQDILNFQDKIATLCCSNAQGHMPSFSVLVTRLEESLMC